MEAFREALTLVVARNEILRTTFPAVQGNPVQRVHPAEPISLPLIDFSEQTDARARGIAQLREDALLPLNLENGPLMRFTLVRIAPEEHWLLRASHQILTDGWSVKLFFEELEAAYKSVLQSRAASAESSAASDGARQIALQYGDYADWERSAFAPDSGYRAELVAWWKDTLAHQPATLDLPFRAHLILPRASAAGPSPPMVGSPAD